MLVAEFPHRIMSPPAYLLQKALIFLWRWQVAQEFLKEIPLVRTASVLEIGCGSGYFIERLARIVRGGKAVGVDLSERRIRRAMRRCEGLDNVEFYLGAAEVLPWETDSFDCVACLDSFYGYSNPSIALTEMRRVLKRGGKLFLGVRGQPDRNGAKRGWRSLLNFVSDGYLPEDYVRYFEHSGFLGVQQKVTRDYVLTLGVKA